MLLLRHLNLTFFVGSHLEPSTEHLVNMAATPAPPVPVLDFESFLGSGSSSLDYATYGLPAVFAGTGSSNADQPDVSSSEQVRQKRSRSDVAEETPTPNKALKPRYGAAAELLETPTIHTGVAIVEGPLSVATEFEDPAVVANLVQAICSEFGESNAESVRLSVLALGCEGASQLRDETRKVEVSDRLSVSCTLMF